MPIPQLGQAQPVQHMIGVAARRVVPIREQEHFFVNPGREELHAHVVGAVPHAATQLPPGQLPPSHAHAALVGSAQANRDLRQARLAHAVFSRQRHDLPRFHGKADIGEQQVPAARNRQAVHLQGRGFQTRAESFTGRGPLAFPREPRGKRRRLQGRPNHERGAPNPHGNALGALHGEHIVARENRPHPPGLHIAEPVGALHQVRDAMLGHHQRVALPLQLHQHRAQLLSRIFVEVRRGLVHHHEPRRRSKRRGDSHALLLPAGKLVHRYRAQTVQTQTADRRIGAPHHLLGGIADVLAPERHLARQLTGEELGGRVLKHASHQLGSSPRLHIARREPAQEHVAGNAAAIVAPGQAVQDAHDRGFTAARRAHEHDAFAGMHVQIHGMQRFRSAVVREARAFQLRDKIAGHPNHPPRTTQTHAASAVATAVRQTASATPKELR